MKRKLSAGVNNRFGVPKATKDDGCDSFSCVECSPYPPCDENESILKLNDDCLSEVLSYLSDNDLCEIRDTCHRFKKLAEEDFRPRYNRRWYTTLSKHFTTNAETSTILMHFGQCIESLRVEDIEHEEWLFLSKYCTRFSRINIIYEFPNNLPTTIRKLLFENVSEFVVSVTRITGHILQEIVCECKKFENTTFGKCPL